MQFTYILYLFYTVTALENSHV